MHSSILIFLRITNEQKALKKIHLYMNTLLDYIRKAKVKLINMTLPYQCRKVKIVAGHPALILNQEATLSSNYAAKANAGVTDFLKEAARRARGDVLASIVCPLITRRAAPTQHIRPTSLFLESYIIPKMLMNKINIVKNE